VALDVLDLDDGVVDEDADHEREGQQRHRVEREAHQVHHGVRRDHRQGQCHGGHEGGAPVAQKQEHDEDGQRGALVEQQHRALVILDDGRDEVDGLGHRRHWMLCHEPFERGAHALRDIDFTGAPCTHDLEAHDGAPIQECDRPLFRHRV
jgi:hypothetical protein